LHHVEALLRNAIDAQFAPVDAGAAPRDTWLDDSAILTPESRSASLGRAIAFAATGPG